MIVINKNTANDVLLTLTENCTTNNPDYLFVFTNETTKTIKTFHAEDLKSYPGRANDFIITDSTTELPFEGQMDFTVDGFWVYSVYEMTPASPPNLNPDDAIDLLETGKVFVISPAVVIPAFDEDETPQIKSFDID